MVELTDDERKALAHGAAALGALAGTCYAAGLRRQGEDAAVSAATLENLAARSFDTENADGAAQ